MTNTSSAAQTLDELRTMTDTQARDLHAELTANGQLTPPPQLPTLPRAELPASVEALTDTLTGQALAWGNMALHGSAQAHYSNGLLYAGSMLASCKALDPDPVHVLSMFSIWAVSFARDVLTESGMSEGQASDLIDALGDSPAQVRDALTQLPHGMARGAFMAALGVFYAASHALTGSSNPDDLHTFLALHGHALAGPDFTPSTGEGMRA